MVKEKSMTTKCLTSPLHTSLRRPWAAESKGRIAAGLSRPENNTPRELSFSDATKLS